MELSDGEYDRWRAWLAGCATLLLTLAAIVRFLREPWYISEDSALFQHGGWYITQGATPYVDFFDIKPPLIYAVTTFLSVLSGGNMAVLHLLSIVVASGAVIAGATFVGVLTHRVTGDAFGSMIAGLAIFVLPTLYTFPSAGIRPKYLAFAAGVAGLLLAVDDRPTAGGAAGAIGAAFWQLAAPVALLVVLVAWERRGSRAMGRAIAGGAVVAVLVVAPFVAAGLTIPLFVETVLVPVYGVERYTLLGRLLEIVVELGPGIVLIPIGIAGWREAVRLDRAHWWIPAGGFLYLLQLFLEFQGAIEAVFAAAFLAIGVGVVIAHRPTPRGRHLVAAVVAILAITSLLWLGGGFGPVADRVEQAQADHAVPNHPELPAVPADVPSMQSIYWEQRHPEVCHYRMGQKQRWFVAATGGSLEAETCGEWPFEDPPLDWMLDRLSIGAVLAPTAGR